MGKLGFFFVGILACVLLYLYSSKSEFQIIQLGDFVRNQFLIDRINGRIWRQVCSGEVKGAECKGMFVWEEMYIEGLTPEYSRPGQSYGYHLELQAEKKPAKGKI